MGRRKIDLARAKTAEERIAQTLRDHPETAERTARFFASEPTDEEMEELMEDKKPGYPLQLRLTDDVLERVDAYLERLRHDPEIRALGRVSRSTALRLLILRGLEVVERQKQE